MELYKDEDLFYLDKCTVCGEPGSKACGACELEYYCGKDHQKQDWAHHRQKCCKYEIKNLPQHGFCMVAKKSISPGEVIAAEYPLTTYFSLRDQIVDLQKLLLLSGAAAYRCPSCDGRRIFQGKCYRCSKCGLPLCGKNCEDSKLHSELECQAIQSSNAKVLETESLQDIFTDLAILRVFLKEERKGSPISFDSPKWNRLLKIIFAEKLQGENQNPFKGKEAANEDIIASINAVEHLPLSLKIIGNQELVVLLHCGLNLYGTASEKESRRKFLFTKIHRLSHSCIPNSTVWVEDELKNNKMIIKATRWIQPGQRITINKGEKFVGLATLERRKQLKKHLGINCKCPRCKDPTEMGLYLSAIRCEENLTPTGCKGHYISSDPLNENANWKCSSNKACKSIKSYQQIKSMLLTIEQELPSVNGQADVVLKQLKDFDEYYSGDVLCSSHFMIRLARSRMRQVIKYFLNSGEKLFLCVINDFPRAYEYCTTLIKSIDSLLFFIDKVNSNFNESRGQLLYENATAKLSLALYNYLVLRSLITTALVVKLQDILASLKEAASAISFFTHASAKSLSNDINFMGSLIRKLVQDCSFQGGQNNISLNTGKIEEVLNRSFLNWKSKAKEIGLAAFYMEPSSKEHSRIISKENLREIITFCL